MTYYFFWYQFSAAKAELYSSYFVIWQKHIDGTETYKITLTPPVIPQGDNT